MTHPSLNELLDERGKTHGNWIDNAQLAQRMKEEWRKAEGWQRLSCSQREGLERIAEKIAGYSLVIVITGITG